MDEQKRPDERLSGVKIKTPLLEKLENFWYHYKWHSIIALFLVITITICSLQMCSKQSYDTYIMYAGEKEISRNSVNGNIPAYNTTVSSLVKAADDYDQNGQVSVAFLTLFVPSAEDIENAEKDEDTEVSYDLVGQDRQTLSDRMIYSEYYVCLISPEVYEQYKTVQDVQIFLPLAPYAPAESEFEYYSDKAIYLRSTEFYSLPGICDLPQDTLICLRGSSAIANHFGGKTNSENFERAEQVVRNILNYN